MKRPKVPYPEVMVSWVDIEGHTSWTDDSEEEIEGKIRSGLDTLAYTKGWLIKETEEVVVVASSIRPSTSKHQDEGIQLSDITVIPAGVVKAIERRK